MKMPKSKEMTKKNDDGLLMPLAWSTVQRKVNDLVPMSDNPRKISEAKMAKLIESLTRFNVVDIPVIDHDGTLVGFHQRLKALQAMGRGEEMIDVRMPNRPLTTPEHKEYTLLQNLHFGDWDDEVLEEFSLGLDMEGLGFEVDDFKSFEDGLEAATAKKKERKLEAVEDDGPGALPDAGVTVRGDVWELVSVEKGLRHRVMCGDSTVVDDVEKLMGGEKADMIFTDPPYNVASHSENFAADVSKAMNDLKNSSWDKDFDIEAALASLRLCVKPDCTLYIWTSHYLAGRIWEYFSDADCSSYLVWSKPNPMPSLSKRHPTWSTELCCYFSFGSKRIVNFPTEGHFLSCREVIKKSDGSHPTQKPIELIAPILEFSSNTKSIVADVFLGSGSTLIACEQLTRHCRGMELDEKYCDVIVRRWLAWMEKEGLEYEVLLNGEAAEERVAQLKGQG